jgi:hypothetical protein
MKNKASVKTPGITDSEFSGAMLKSYVALTDQKKTDLNIALRNAHQSIYRAIGTVSSELNKIKPTLDFAVKNIADAKASAKALFDVMEQGGGMRDVQVHIDAYPPNAITLVAFAIFAEDRKQSEIEGEGKRKDKTRLDASNRAKIIAKNFVRIEFANRQQNGIRYKTKAEFAGAINLELKVMPGVKRSFTAHSIVTRWLKDIDLRS